MFMPDAKGSFQSLAGVHQLFFNNWILLAGWVHYLAFDLFVGSWIVRDAQALKLAHYWVIPILPLTFILGPVGFMFYQGLKLVTGSWRQAKEGE